MRFKLGDLVLWHGKYQSYEGTIVAGVQERFGEAFYVVEREGGSLVKVYEDCLSFIARGPINAN